MTNGKFIVFEGGEGTGKSTQIRLLERHLQENLGCEVVLSWEPGGTPLGEKIRSILLDPTSGKIAYKAEALLYSAARAEHVDKVIRPALERGAVVLCDRYIDASKAYQGWGRKLGLQSIHNLNDWATDGTFPDHVFVFDLDPKLGMERVIKRQDGKLDRLEQEKIEFHQDIRAAYLHMAKSHPDSYTVIDSQRSIEEIHAAILKAITRIF
ncbi:MAG TPA: dTMP kinase [Bdellovibrionota bacterium]|jgi:dTMP kinase|nr:dTMP kinase [Bdellovibrionota bacterium]